MGQNIINTWGKRRWELRRNQLVCKLLDENKSMSRKEALRKANEMMNGMDNRPGKQTPR